MQADEDWSLGVPDLDCEGHDCLEALLERYRDKIRACAWKMVGDPDEIEDLTQETFLRLIRSFPGFQARSSLTTWVYQVARNTCIDAYRRRSRRPVVSGGLWADDAEGSAGEPVGAETLDPEALFEDAIAECYVAQALRELPGDYARIATLRLIDGWSNEEVARALGTSVQSVKGKLKRARTMLRAKLSTARSCPLCRAGTFRFERGGLA